MCDRAHAVCGRVHACVVGYIHLIVDSYTYELKIRNGYILNICRIAVCDRIHAVCGRVHAVCDRVHAVCGRVHAYVVGYMCMW